MTSTFTAISTGSSFCSRISRYSVFGSLDEATDFGRARSHDPFETVFKKRYEGLFESETTSLLKPAPLARLRSCCGF
jgi:hypothetical protein